MQAHDYRLCSSLCKKCAWLSLLHVHTGTSTSVNTQANTNKTERQLLTLQIKPAYIAGSLWTSQGGTRIAHRHSTISSGAEANNLPGNEQLKMKLTDEVVRSFRVAKVFRENTDRINCMDFSANGEHLISSSNDDSIVIYCCQEGRCALNRIVLLWSRMRSDACTLQTEANSLQQEVWMWSPVLYSCSQHNHLLF